MTGNVKCRECDFGWVHYYEETEKLSEIEKKQLIPLMKISLCATFLWADNDLKNNFTQSNKWKNLMISIMKEIVNE